MSIKVAKNRFILSSSLQIWTELYQHLLSGISSYQELGHKLVKEAETAKAFRHLDKLEGVSQLLLSLPLRELHIAGQYYQGWKVYMQGQQPQGTFEHVLENSNICKAGALIGLAAIEAQKGNYELELKFFNRAFKFAERPSIMTEIQRSIAVVKAKEGFHRQSLNDLEAIYPYARRSGPYTYYQYLNSLAVELGEMGRVEEAHNVCKVVLASPYAFAYPEWRETSQEIALRGYRLSRSAVSFALKPIPENVVTLPERTGSNELELEDNNQPGQLYNFLEWKSKMVKEPNGDTKDKLIPKNLDELTDNDMRVRIFSLACQDDVSREKLKKILKFVIDTTTKPDKEK